MSNCTKSFWFSNTVMFQGKSLESFRMRKDKGDYTSLIAKQDRRSKVHKPTSSWCLTFTHMPLKDLRTHSGPQNWGETALLWMNFFEQTWDQFYGIFRLLYFFLCNCFNLKNLETWGIERGILMVLQAEFPFSHSSTPVSSLLEHSLHLAGNPSFPPENKKSRKQQTWEYLNISHMGRANSYPQIQAQLS